MLLNLVYCLALLAVLPMVTYRMARYGRYRRGLRQKFCGLSSDDLAAWGWDREPASPLHRGPVVWFHAVSLGEVNLVAGLVEAFRRARPECRIVVSTSTDTGYDLARARLADLPIFFCPLDFSWAVEQTMRQLRPQLLVLAELELWPNLIRSAKRHGCAVALVNGRMSRRSCDHYVRFGRLLAPTFARLDWVGCQDDDAAGRYAACGTRPSAITITGSVKFDNAPETRDTVEIQRIARWSGVEPWQQVFVAGSTQQCEELAALRTYRALAERFRELRLVIVPRHRDRFDAVAELIAQQGYRVRRRSVSGSASAHWPADTIVLVDTIGELQHWWGLGRIALVGGSFGERGGQNMLEPAGYGCATCFGPSTENFADIARQLLAADAAVRLQSTDELTPFVARCLDEPPAADRLGLRAREVVNAHRGATSRTIRCLLRLLPQPTTEARAA